MYNSVLLQNYLTQYRILHINISDTIQWWHLLISEQLNSIQNEFLELQQKLQLQQELQSAVEIDSLADAIRKERKKQNLTLHGLSDLSGVSYSTLAKLESGDDGISLRLLKTVTSALGMKLWIA